MKRKRPIGRFPRRPRKLDKNYKEKSEAELQKLLKKCEDCDECVYIGEGDYACMKGTPKIVITEFIIATTDYGKCSKKKATKDTDQSSPR